MCKYLCMADDDYRRALEAAVREYESLGEERQRIDRRLAELAQTMSTLSRLCGIVPTVSVGLNDVCRMALRGAGVPMTPVEVRERVKAIGFDLGRYSNDLAAVHTTLKRLNEAGELRFIARPGTGEKSYVWDRPARAALLGPDIASVKREMDEKRRVPRTKKRPS